MPVQLPPPPVAISAAPVQQLALWRAGAVSCEGGVATPVRPPAPQPIVRLAYGATANELTLSFSIAATGHPLDIRRVVAGYVPYADDLGPALAATMFPARARTGCTVTFTIAERPVREAPLADLLGYVAQASTAPSTVVRARLDAAGECSGPYPTVSVRAFPDLKALPMQVGSVGWTWTRFDIDAGGKPGNLVTAASSGNAALDRAAIDALRRSRFAGGARRGCMLPTRIAAATLVPPTPPEEAALRPADATCPATLPFATPPRLTMPQAWQRRSIEGWAVLAYDVAPWGAIGNVRVLAVQPAAEFGDWAQSVMRQATKATTSTGYVGCVDRVIFRIGEEERLVLNGAAPPD